MTEWSPYINEEKTLKVFRWLRNQVPSIRGVDSSMSIISFRIFQLCSWWSVELDTLCSDSLERSKGERPSLNGVGGSNELQHYY